MEAVLEEKKHERSAANRQRSAATCLGEEDGCIFQTT